MSLAYEREYRLAGLVFASFLGKFSRLRPMVFIHRTSRCSSCLFMLDSTLKLFDRVRDIFSDRKLLDCELPRCFLLRQSATHNKKNIANRVTLEQLLTVKHSPTISGFFFSAGAAVPRQRSTVVNQKRNTFSTFHPVAHKNENANSRPPRDIKSLLFFC